MCPGRRERSRIFLTPLRVLSVRKRSRLMVSSYCYSTTLARIHDDTRYVNESLYAIAFQLTILHTKTRAYFIHKALWYYSWSNPAGTFAYAILNLALLKNLFMLLYLKRTQGGSFVGGNMENGKIMNCRGVRATSQNFGMTFNKWNVLWLPQATSRTLKEVSLFLLFAG